MGLESWWPKNESEFYGLVREMTESWLFLERVEPANESGFPDVHFAVRPDHRRFYFHSTDHGHVPTGPREGTIELKNYKGGEKFDLSKSKVRGNQKAAFIEYHLAGGERRFMLAHHRGIVHLLDTANSVCAITRKPYDERTLDLNTFVVDGKFAPTYDQHYEFKRFLGDKIA